MGTRGAPAEPTQRSADAMLIAAGATLGFGALAIGLESSFAVIERSNGSATIPLLTLGGASLAASIPLAAIGGARRARFTLGPRARLRRRAQRFVIAGAVILPLAVLGAGLGGAAAVIAHILPDDDDHEEGNDPPESTYAALALPGAAMIPVAAGLLGYGIALRRRTTPRVSVVPQLGVRYAGIMLTGRF